MLTLTFVTVAGNTAQAAGSGAGSGGGVFQRQPTNFPTTTQLLDTIVSTNIGGGGAADNLGGVAPYASGGQPGRLGGRQPRPGLQPRQH